MWNMNETAGRARVLTGLVLALGIAAPGGASAEALRDPAASLKQAQKLFRELEYDRVMPLAREVLASPDAKAQQRVDAYILLGSSQAIAGNPVEAENTFRLLLRAVPDYDMPDTTSPKILRVFRCVKLQENKLQAETRALEHLRLVESLKLENRTPYTLLGGDPLTFSFDLADPKGGVAGLRVEYRRQGASEYSVVVPERKAGARWTATLPPEATENTDGLRLEYSVTAVGRAGDALAQLGRAPGAPLAIDVRAGTLADRIPFYRKAWFWSVVGAAVVAAGGGTYYAYRTRTSLPGSDLGTVSVR